MRPLKPAASAEKIRTLTNARIYPAAGDFTKGWNCAFGVASSMPENDPAEFAMVRGHRSWIDRAARERYDRTEPVRLPGRHLYCGPLPKHFGHFLADGAHRLWACRYLQHEVDALIWLPNNPAAGQADVFRFFLELFGVDKSKILCIDAFTVVDELIVPTPGYMLGRPHRQWYQEELRTAIDMRSFMRHDLPTRVFMSRRNYLLQGRVAGSDYLASFLAADGYEEIFPEKLSIEEQISHVVSAEMMVFEEGSAIHMLDPLPPIAGRAAVIRRRPSPTGDWFEETVVAKARGAAYRNVELLPGSSPSGTRMARYRDPTELFSWLADNSFSSSQRFDIRRFQAEEAMDIALHQIREAHIGKS